MPRDYKVYLEDILQALVKIEAYTTGLQYAAFAEDQRTQDAVVRNLEVIGEAAKSIPEAIRSQHPAVDWKRIVGLRNILIHQYFGVDVELIWDIVQNKLPALEGQVRALLND